MRMKKFLKHLFHFPRFNSKTYYLESARQYREEALCAEASLSKCSRQLSCAEHRCIQLESALRQVIASAAGGLTSYVKEEKIYQNITSCFDPDGDTLLAEAELMWGKFNFDAHMDEAWDGRYDNASSSDMFLHLVNDVKEQNGDTGMFREQLAQVYRNTLVKLTLLNNVFYVTPVHKPVPLYCNEHTTAKEAKTLYELHQKKLDANGFRLFWEAEKILGKFNESDFYYEANRGSFEFADGFTMLKYLLVQYEHLLGEQSVNRWEAAATSPILCERCVDFTIHATPEYVAFEETLYRNICLTLGLLHTEAALKAELSRREQCEDIGMNTECGSPMDRYTTEEIYTALQW